MPLLKNAVPISFRLKKEGGETIVSMLVSLFLMGLVFATTLSHFLEVSRRAYDQEIIAATEEQAKAILDLMAFELRMTGAGMPLGQLHFGTAIGQAALPIFTSSNNTNINIRLNEYGLNTALVEDYTPSLGSLSFNVLSAEDFETGDTIYISNMSTGGTHGLQGIVSAVNGNTITIGAGFQASTAAVFRTGSLVARVTNVSFSSAPNFGGITRNAELGPVMVAPSAMFNAIYLNESNLPLSLPLSPSSIINEVAAILLTVSVRSNQPIRGGGLYVAEAEQIVALRNLNYNR